MTEKQFAEITVKLWRLKQQYAKLLADIRTRGVALPRRNCLRGERTFRPNPSVVKLDKNEREQRALATRLGCAA